MGSIPFERCTETVIQLLFRLIRSPQCRVFRTSDAEPSPFERCWFYAGGIFCLHVGERSSSCLLRHWIILSFSRFVYLHSLPTSSLHAWTNSWNFFISPRVSLQAGDTSFECSLRHCTTCPPAAGTSLHSLAASSAQGFAFCAAGATAAIVRQSTPASRETHFAGMPENTVLVLIIFTPPLRLINSADISERSAKPRIHGLNYITCAEAGILPQFLEIA